MSILEATNRVSDLFGTEAPGYPVPIVVQCALKAISRIGFGGAPHITIETNRDEGPKISSTTAPKTSESAGICGPGVWR